VDSIPGESTTFSVLLPIKTQAEAIPTEEK
jgi:hypothetical protein